MAVQMTLTLMTLTTLSNSKFQITHPPFFLFRTFAEVAPWPAQASGQEFEFLLESARRQTRWRRFHLGGREGSDATGAPAGVGWGTVQQGKQGKQGKQGTTKKVRTGVRKEVRKGGSERASE